MLTIILKQPLGLDLSLGRELNWAWRCCRPRDSTLSFLPKGTGPCQILNGHLLPPSTFLLSQTQVSASLHGWHFTLQSRRLNQFSGVNRTVIFKPQVIRDQILKCLVFLCIYGHWIWSRHNHTSLLDFHPIFCVLGIYHAHLNLASKVNQAVLYGTKSPYCCSVWRARNNDLVS